MSDVAAFLEDHPWPAEWAALGEPHESLWAVDLDAPIGVIWPQLIETSAFNQRLGLPEMSYAERKGRMHGTTRNVGITMSWEEIPWEWEYGRTLFAARVYTKGFAKVVRVRYLVDALPDERTRVTIYFGWIPQGRAGRMLIKVSMPRIQAGYERVLQEIAAEAMARPPAERLAPLPPPRSVATELDESRVEGLGRLLIDDHGQPPELVARLSELIRTADDALLYRLRLKVLARHWGMEGRAEMRQLLSLALHACRVGLLRLTWDVICPHCRGVREEHVTLGEMRSEGRCDACEIDFDTTREASLEVTFHVHPGVRVVKKRFFCAAEPAAKTHILISQRLRPAETRRLPTRVPPGRYRLRIQGSERFVQLDLVDGADERALEWTPALDAPLLTLAPQPELTLRNDTAAEQVFVLEQRDPDRDRLRPVELFCFQQFRDLFAEEAVATDLQLDVGAATILFTDLVGSTRLYHESGDAAAFAAVRRHFLVTYRAVRENRGAVVKTIGDAAMAAFTRPADALRASVELQRYFTEDNPDTDLRLRISLHSGPCLAVRLNANIDYFGRTVNLSAKLQSIVEGGQIVWTQAVHDDPGVEETLRALGVEAEALTFPMTWDRERTELPVHRATVS